MLIRFSKNNPAKQGFLLILLSIACFAKSFLDTGFANGRIYLLWLLVLAESMFVAYVLQKFKLSKNALFVSLVYLTARTAYGFNLAPMPDTILKGSDFVPFLLLFACYYFLQMYEAEFSLPALLNGAVIWASAVFICPTLVYTLPCIFLILLVYSANRGRIWGVAILGMALPFALIGIWDFLNDTPLLANWFSRIPPILPALPFTPDHLPFYFTLVWLVLTLIGWFYQKNNPIEGEIVERKRAAALSAALVFFLLIFCLIKADPTITTMPLLLPAAYLTGDYFSRKKETLLSEGLFILFIVLGLLSVCL